jgi:mRNA interferase MazF
MNPNPKRGDIWDADLEPVKGHEQGGRRPVLIVSDDGLNQSRAELVIAIPLSTKDKKVRSHVAIAPPEGGLTEQSFAKTEAIRSISTDRLSRRRGSVSEQTLAEVELRLRFLLGL